MRFRRVTVSIMVSSFLLALSTREAAAQGAPHSATPASLHSTIQAAQGEVKGARTYVNSILAQPEIQKRVKRAGVSPDLLNARLATLADSEVVQLQKQLMSAELQETPAGRMDTATAYIIGVLLGVALIVIIVAVAAGSAYTPIYYY